jgi:glycosyltransferase involved in cell wall biosynthesis
MALYGDLTYDSRVQREARTLAAAGYQVTIVCLAARMPADFPTNVQIVIRRPSENSVLPGSANPFFALSSVRFAAIRGRVAWLRSYIRNLRAWGRLAVEAAPFVDVWHAHDLTGLAAVAPYVPRDVRIVYDSHELFLDTGTALRLPAPVRAVLRAYERRLVTRASAVVTVNESLAAILRRRFKLEAVVAIHNCPDRWSPPAGRSTILREAAGVPDDAPLVLYHGALSPNRGVEKLMEALLVPDLQHAHLVLMGFGEQREALVGSAAEARWKHRIHVLEPVRPDELLAWVASADIGAMPIQSSTRNLRLSTPNKLFECLAAGIPVVVSDFPAMRRIVRDNPGGPLGAVCDPSRVESIANAILSILRLEPPEMKALRARCSQAAADRWNWDHEAETLLSVYSMIIPALRPRARVRSTRSCA